MAELNTQLKELQQAIQTLLKQYQRLQKENAVLKEEIKAKDLLLLNKNESMEQLHQKLEASRLGLASFADADKQYLQKRINAYLSDIEKCIAALNL